MSSKWFAGAKVCYVCGNDHLARTKHSKSEVLAAIARLKEKHASAMLIVEDLALVVDELITEDCDKADVDDIALSEEEGETHAFIADDPYEIHKTEEIRLANISFMHGRTFAKDLQNETVATHAELSEGEYSPFRDLHIDTCANKSPVMSLSQYKDYCSEFQVPVRIDRSKDKSLRGIGGRSQPIGTATIPVPFRDLNLVIDVQFQIVPDSVPSLLSMKDMV